MRAGIPIIALAAMLAGCTTKKPAVPMTELRHQADLQYVDAGGPGLAFDPPIAQDNPHLNLSRDSRQPTAFVGFDQTTTTFFYVRSDDRQSLDPQNDRFERRAISEQYGTSYR